MRIGIFGGAFNPVHNGHLKLCDQCQKIYNFDKILIIPTYISPHKKADNPIDFGHRYNMLKFAVEDNPVFEVSDIEQHIGGISYTYDTILRLKKTYQGAEFFLIIGSDMFESFHKWRNFIPLMELVTLVVGARKPDAKLELIKKQLNAEKIDIIPVNVYEISSTQIRQMIFDKKDTSEHLNPKVFDYCKANDLYSVDYEKISNHLLMLTKKRYDHVMSVVKFSGELGLHYGVKSDATRLAAMLHDVTKEYNFDKQLQMLNYSDIISANLMHAKTAYIFAKDELGIVNADVLNAILYHTTGRAGMSLLEKIIYVADACAYDRQYPDAEAIRQLAYENINAAIVQIIEFSVTSLFKKRVPIDPKTIECYNHILGETQHENKG